MAEYLWSTPAASPEWIESAKLYLKTQYPCHTEESLFTLLEDLESGSLSEHQKQSGIDIHSLRPAVQETLLETFWIKSSRIV